jgi:dihydroorotate dehydrogenase electron transfer subunit
MYFVAREAAKDGCKLDVFVGARSREHLLYLKEFDALSKTKIHIATDDGSKGFKGFNVTLLQQRIAEAGAGKAFDQIFACGPERMLLAVSELSFHRKIPAQLSLERYMKCGYGLCGNCVVDPLGIRLCTDGPVVKNELCRKITEFGQYHRDALGKRQMLH